MDLNDHTCKSVDDLKRALDGAVHWHGDSAHLDDAAALREGGVDSLAYTAALGEGPARDAARRLIRELSAQAGCPPASIQGLYAAVARGDEGGFTTPAINVRGMTYDVARAALRAAKARDVGAIVFEIARSEIGYTEQRPAEYASSVLAAAIKEDWGGPVFIQGDHFQVKPAKYREDAEGELGAIRGLIDEAIGAGFYNIDIDASTLVDLSQGTVEAQQAENARLTAEFTRYIREREPADTTVSVGGEIGEVGTENTTPEELDAYTRGVAEALPEAVAGPSKLSVQTGTSHGGTVNPDGTVAPVEVDYDALTRLSEMARERGMAGAVQHGASTLRDDQLAKLPGTGCVEVHLATGFQNQIYAHDALPGSFRDRVDDHLREHLAGDRKAGWTDAQFIYKTRKKGFGPMKREWWTLPAEDVKAPIMRDLQSTFERLWGVLKVEGTRGAVARRVDAAAATA